MNRKKILSFVLMALFLLVQIYLFFVQPVRVLDYPKTINEHPLPLFGENKDVSQEFRTSGRLARIDIMLANYLVKPKSGNLRLTIFDKNGRERFTQDFPANTVEDNRFYAFPIRSAELSRGPYRLELKYLQPDQSQKLAVWISRNSLYPYGKLYVNGIGRDGSMTFRVYYYSTIWQERGRWLNAVPEFPARPYILALALIILLLLLNGLFYYFAAKAR